MPERLRLLLSCEHAGNEVPARYAALFAGHEKLLNSHRGWDPGALDCARHLAATLTAPLHQTTVTRLLIEPNRSPGHPGLFSELSRTLPAQQKDALVRSVYLPYRQGVEGAVRTQVERGRRVLHLSVHSFTSVYNGMRRNADLGLLYDPQRTVEKWLCARWRRSLRASLPHLRVRRNYPYRGVSDSLVTSLRRRFPPAGYLGIELEINQALAAPADREMLAGLAATLRDLLAEAP